jgi:transposase
MDYPFGPNKPKFTGTYNEWNRLKEEIAWWNDDTSDCPFVTVICPHCGTKNTHKLDGIRVYRECHLMLDKKGKKIHYECPGYVICRYINTPR